MCVSIMGRPFLRSGQIGFVEVPAVGGNAVVISSKMLNCRRPDWHAVLLRAGGIKKGCLRIARHIPRSDSRSKYVLFRSINQGENA